MRLNAKGIISIFAFLSFFKQTQQKRNYQILFMGKKKCRCCKDVLKTPPYYIIIPKKELYTLLDYGSDSLKSIKPTSNVSDSLNNFTLINKKSKNYFKKFFCNHKI